MFQKLKRYIKYRLYSPALYAVDIALTNLKKVGVSRHRKPQTTLRRNELLRTLIVTDDESYPSQVQFAPFFIYRKALRLRFGFVFKLMLLEDVLHHTNAIRGFDLIFVKLLFTLEDAQAQKIIKHIHAAKGQAKLIYFDGDDDVCIQWPDIFPYLDLYVKMHVFSDPDQYGRRFVGKSNLTDYVASRWGVSFANNIIPHSKSLPSEQRYKLFLGSNMVLKDHFRKLYLANLASKNIIPKENDVVCRANVSSGTWLYYLRRDVTPKLHTLTPKYKVLTPIKRVSEKEYYREMLSSKICLSPFGYGEICVRDFEAIFCRCLLIKPDMAHIRTSPDIFVPNESYVPIKWDFSDFNEKCIYYLEHDDERERIVEYAYQIVADYYRNDSFIDLFADMLERLDLVHL